MRRALQTCYEVFKDHPNFENIKIMVDPGLREDFDTIKGITGDTH